MNGNARRRRRRPRVASNVDRSNSATRAFGGRESASPSTEIMDTGGREPTTSWIIVNAVFYVLSGVTQPILMAYAKHAGLGEPRCQLYMLFYYVGPAAVALSLRRGGEGNNSRDRGGDEQRAWPSRSLLIRAAGIAAFDIFAQSMTYTGECARCRFFL